jgi:hypothetical protein
MPSRAGAVGLDGKQAKAATILTQKVRTVCGQLLSALYVCGECSDGVDNDAQSRTKDEAIRQRKQPAMPCLLVLDACWVIVINAI